jgi:hypothetical protein
MFHNLNHVFQSIHTQSKRFVFLLTLTVYLQLFSYYSSYLSPTFIFYLIHVTLLSVILETYYHNFTNFLKR